MKSRIFGTIHDTYVSKTLIYFSFYHFLITRYFRFPFIFGYIIKRAGRIKSLGRFIQVAFGTGVPTIPTTSTTTGTPVGPEVTELAETTTSTVTTKSGQTTQSGKTT